MPSSKDISTQNLRPSEADYIARTLLPSISNLELCNNFHVLVLSPSSCRLLLLIIATRVCLNLESLKVQQSILASAKLSAIHVTPNIKLGNVEVLKLYYSVEL
jgi:hypothetical protein